MPEVIVVFAIIISLFGAFSMFFSTYDPCIPCGVILVILFSGALTWEVLANKHHTVRLKQTYNIDLVTDGHNKSKQISIVENKVIDITKEVGKIVNEKECRLLVIKYKVFSYGMLMMFADRDKLSIVCAE